jgi:hypothetical protein
MVAMTWGHFASKRIPGLTGKLILFKKSRYPFQETNNQANRSDWPPIQYSQGEFGELGAGERLF